MERGLVYICCETFLIIFTGSFLNEKEHWRLRDEFIENGMKKYLDVFWETVVLVMLNMLVRDEGRNFFFLTIFLGRDFFFFFPTLCMYMFLLHFLYSFYLFNIILSKFIGGKMVFLTWTNMTFTFQCCFKLHWLWSNLGLCHPSLLLR